MERLDPDSALRPTIIKPGSDWTRRSQKVLDVMQPSSSSQGLLGAPTSAMLSTSDQKRAKEEAFDLLDGLTKAGALVCDHACLHVVTSPVPSSLHAVLFFLISIAIQH